LEQVTENQPFAGEELQEMLKTDVHASYYLRTGVDDVTSDVYEPKVKNILTDEETLSEKEEHLRKRFDLAVIVNDITIDTLKYQLKEMNRAVDGLLEQIKTAPGDVSINDLADSLECIVRDSGGNQTLLTRKKAMEILMGL
jgi:Tfp pilus assembly protein PilO